MNPDLIRKLFEDKADPIEWEAVMDYLSRHPEAMEKLFPAGEWHQVDGAKPLPEDVQSEMLQRIREQLVSVPRKTPILRFTPKRGAAAAILLLIAGATFWHQQKQKSIVLASTVTISEPASSHINRINNTDKPMAIRLPDGSAVRLQSHASLQYDTLFGVAGRNVYLRGEAFFDVVKDRERPFTVFAGPLRTTVLGTTFRIKASRKNTEVKLFTGKVVVRPIDKLDGWKQDIYLSPGERLSYNRTTEKLVVARPPKQIRTPGRPVEQQEFAFSNAPLKEVMDQLSFIYHYKIVYDSRDIAGMNFTGTVSRSDSLVVVLKLIAAMNELEVREEGNSYVIGRSPK